ncbi:FUSC family protein [Vibrio superstes]|uniref:Fusaric acid resistance protein n=1 Tax=Vibrio superstes NBRC 103154 TaxID=1219062 RepID=A0A511QQF8_9VIBR|nr:FUSC family protein [Vibrio superstes]GEM79136.1 fusaric acid resistance protein [Vibrio superstes NBRC 103154]
MIGVFTLSRSTQDAIKVALSVSLSICLALWFGWDKPYWAGIAVIVAAANESYSHSIRKGINRLLGTIFGVVCAGLLLMYFPQDHLMFIFCFSLLLAVCSFMGSHKKFGYAFTITFTVCTLVASMGSFDGANTFNIAILRIQETVLGLFVFSVVFSLLWPQKTEDNFFELLTPTTENLTRKLAQRSSTDTESDDDFAQQQQANLSKLKAILDLPLNGSYRLRYERAAWRVIVQTIEILEVLAELPKATHAVEGIDIHDGQHLLTKAIANPMETKGELQQWLKLVESKYTIPKVKYSAFDLPLETRLANVVRSLSILLTGLVVWWYVPIPGAYMMPMMCAIFANVLVSLPNSAIGQAFIGMAVWAVIFLTQYVLILPELTELWQLAGFYFINVFLVWRGTAKPSLALQKLLGVNLLLVMTMSAMYLTPSYSLMTPITMITVMSLGLSIGAFYIKLYRNL